MRRFTIRPTTRYGAVPLIAVAFAAVGAGCGGGGDDNTTSSNNNNASTSTPATTPTQAPSAAAGTIQVSGKEFSFKLSANSVAKPGKVTFDFKNVGTVAHDFSIGGKTTALTSPGDTAKLTVDLTKKGTYPYLCTVPGHAQAGMKGVLTVR